MIEQEFFEKIKNKNILVATSGGVDSMVLLDILFKNKDKYNLNLEVFHFNHKTREGRSDDDEMLVKKISNKLGLVYHSESYSMVKYANENKISEEEAGRYLRYSAMNKILLKKKNYNDWYIAFAHHLNDQVETILMRIIRGTGTYGLIGMKKVENNLLRPMLNYSKEEILEYAKNNNIEYNDDLSNFENDYTRNSIRNELIPFIKRKYNQSFEKAILNLSEIAYNDKKIIDREIQNIVNEIIFKRFKNKTIFKKELFKSLSDYEIIEILRSEIDRINKSNYDFEFVHYKEIIKIIKSKNSVEVVLNNLIFYNTQDKFVISELIDNDLDNEKVFKLTPNQYIINEYEININKDFDEKNKFRTVILPENSIIKIRKRKNGDKIFYKNKYIKLKDFLIDKKIDRYERDYIPILEYNEDIVMVGNLYNKLTECKEGLVININKMRDNYE